MSIISTVLVFVLLPITIISAVAGLALASGAGRRARRYRPGRPYDFTPIWFLASPEQVGVQTPDAASTAIGAGATEPADPVSADPASSDATLVSTGALGGASDNW